MLLKEGGKVGKASTKAKNKYNAENYERISLSVPKGKKEEYKEQAEKAGKSLNQYIIDCIEERNE
jgi:predicted HicB family RNase H-like nuclease